MGPHVCIVKKQLIGPIRAFRQSYRWQLASSSSLERGGAFAPMAYVSLFLGSYPASQTYMGQHGGIVSQPIIYLIRPCEHILQLVWSRNRAPSRLLPSSVA